MTYDEASGLWQATLTGPDRAAWSETAYTFTVTLTAVNDTGETRATYDLTAYRALPSVQTVETPDSITGGTCTLRAHIVIETVPAGGDSPAFAGSAQADFMGTVYVTDNDDNEASLERTVTAIWLVPDRTEADLQSLMALHAAGWDNLTDAQRREWWYGAWREALHWTDGEIMECLDGPLYVLEGFNRGAYNIEDVNRVETAVSYLVERLRSLSAFLAAETKEDWAEEDIPLSSQLARYLANIVSVAGGYDAVLESASISMRPSPSRCRPCRRAWRT